jgi:transposase
MPHLSIEKRAIIISLLQSGLPVKQIAQQQGVHRSTIYQLQKKVEDTGTVQDKPRSGQPHLFTEREERKFSRSILREECTTAVDIHQLL